jgi:peptidoglycan-N-acetylmuramic acid deacetylase
MVIANHTVGRFIDCMGRIDRLMRRGRAAFAMATGIALAGSAVAAPSPGGDTPYACRGVLYLTFDTGSQSQAELIADTLRRHHIKATFFMANEKTVHGDYSLDPSWAPLWKSLLADGHAFGSHTFDHVYAKRDLSNGHIQMKPQFGPQAGQLLDWAPQQYCEEIDKVASRFHQLTGGQIDHYWRAPGGHLTPNTIAAGQACGYRHVAWSAAGFSGDELPSESYPNARLLEQSLSHLRDGDIFLAHMGIWSR